MIMVSLFTLGTLVTSNVLYIHLNVKLFDIIFFFLLKLHQQEVLTSRHPDTKSCKDFREYEVLGPCILRMFKGRNSQYNLL